MCVQNLQGAEVPRRRKHVSRWRESERLSAGEIGVALAKLDLRPSYPRPFGTFLQDLLDDAGSIQQHHGTVDICGDPRSIRRDAERFETGSLGESRAAHDFSTGNVPYLR